MNVFSLFPTGTRLASQIEEQAKPGLSLAIRNQAEWSLETFGPGQRTKGLIEHIRKELLEIEQSPNDLEEWADVVILAFDGAWRAGGTPEMIADAILTKQAKNKGRKWPDWRTAGDRPIEHIRELGEE